MKGKDRKIVTADYKRDTYGFVVRPQHLQRYGECAKIYKEEEKERAQRWKVFLARITESAETPLDELLAGKSGFSSAAKSLAKDVGKTKIGDANDLDERNTKTSGYRGTSNNDQSEESVTREDAYTSSEAAIGAASDPFIKGLQSLKDSMYANFHCALVVIEKMMSYRVNKKTSTSSQQVLERNRNLLAPIDEVKPWEENFNQEFYDMVQADAIQDLSSNIDEAASNHVLEVPSFPWKEELECLVQGGLPMGLRGELWQAFVGVGIRKVDGYYHQLLCQESNTTQKRFNDNGHLPARPQTEKWKWQIEKDLPRTFPGHPALDEDGRNALRRLLTAYARHNPSVGYCQAMNFFAGLLLLLMTEENAFWTLLGIIDDYFEGYYSEEMIESQVDQLVFDNIVREKFPKLANHLDYLGVQVAWVTGPWFLSIFLNMLPWESVLRIWDVLLFDGNRVMLFRTALALMELYGPALVTTKDAGDAVTLLQSLASSTFDSSLLVLTACMGFQSVNEGKLQELRKKHRHEILASMKERSRGLRDSKGLASKLYSFKHDPVSLLPEAKSAEGLDGKQINGTEPKKVGVCNAFADFDLKEQVKWLKVELCRLLEEKRSAVIRAEELETALLEMAKLDNRRVLCAKVERLEQEVSELRQALTDRQEQERAMIQVLMKVEKGQKVAEDARITAEQDAAAQKYAAHVMQEKYEEAMSLLTQMEERAVMAETMLEATLQYQSGQGKAMQQTPESPRTPRSGLDSPVLRGLLSIPFGLGWRDKNKGKLNTEESSEQKARTNDEQNAPAQLNDDVNVPQTYP
ncbi:hypothetical protein HPP92_025065 [Vanilla planifolia]|uniref:Rab-GAP TBC domain-containing protein n=2 Tax=Vanilla planifolia TaxID=51239 RepID=A0A835PHR9_VANPL|nr:hypothetical protein HPP92_025065 [Vanilla planifolia]